MEFNFLSKLELFWGQIINMGEMMVSFWRNMELYWDIQQLWLDIDRQIIQNQWLLRWQKHVKTHAVMDRISQWGYLVKELSIDTELFIEFFTIREYNNNWPLVIIIDNLSVHKNKIVVIIIME